MPSCIFKPPFGTDHPIIIDGFDIFGKALNFEPPTSEHVNLGCLHKGFAAGDIFCPLFSLKPNGFWGQFEGGQLNRLFGFLFSSNKQQIHEQIVICFAWLSWLSFARDDF